MMNSTSGDGDTVAHASIVQGGPIYINNYVGSLTHASEFESAVLHELEELKLELCVDSSSLSSDDDILADELKMFSDEDLVEMALQATLEGESRKESSLQSCQNTQMQGDGLRGEGDLSLPADIISQHERSREEAIESAAIELLNGGDCSEDATLVGTRPSKRRHLKLEQSQSGTSSNAIVSDNTLKKGKRRKADNDSAYERCLEKAQEVLKIKQKQDQDKANARLHSLNSMINKISASDPDKTQGIKYLKFANSGRKVKLSNFEGYKTVQQPDVVLCIEVYHNIQHWTKSQEFLVLGRQFLTELRDKIYCMTDQVMQKANQHDPSGYFLIEDVFCNDTRDKSALDYSKPIFDWLNNSKDEALKKLECIVNGELQKKQKAVLGDGRTAHLPRFRRFEMQKTRFCDLRFCLGVGYLYCHQGDCKHTIVIRDMRLIHPEDIQNRLAYPILTYQPKLRVEKCGVCKIFRATHVTVDDKWAPYNPCYFCKHCFYLLHYSEEGQLLYSDFSTYEYLHD